MVLKALGDPGFENQAGSVGPIVQLLLSLLSQDGGEDQQDATAALGPALRDDDARSATGHLRTPAGCAACPRKNQQIVRGPSGSLPRSEPILAASPQTAQARMWFDLSQ